MKSLKNSLSGSVVGGVLFEKVYNINLKPRHILSNGETCMTKIVLMVKNDWCSVLNGVIKPINIPLVTKLVEHTTDESGRYSDGTEII